MNKGGKFLKKLWCCLSGGVYQDNLLLSIKLLPLIPFITLGHLLVYLFVTAIVFHNWYIVTVVLLLPFSDFLTDSRVVFLNPGNSYKVGGLAVLFFSHFWNLPPFCQLVLMIYILEITMSCFHMFKILRALISLISMWVFIIFPGNVMSRTMYYIYTYLKWCCDQWLWLCLATNMWKYS